MADHTLNLVRASIRAMDELIVPAVDPADPLAREQAGIVAKVLHFLEARLDYRHDRNRFELQHYVSLADEVVADATIVSPAVAETLAIAIAEGTRILGDPAASLGEIRASVHRTAGALTALVRASAHTDEAVRSRIERRVLLASSALLDAQRSWFLPQGWESGPSAVAPAEEFFGTSSTRTATASPEGRIV